MDNFNFNKNANLYIISAPSGAGKTSLVQSLCSYFDFIVPSISYTTRKKRDSEVHGEDYFFISEDEFVSKIKQNYFLEYQNVYGNYYGTCKTETSRILGKGNDIILEIDYKGMLQIKRSLPKALSIYILPPSIQSLRDRLRSRGQDDQDVVEKRMESSINELRYSKFADYVIVNDKFDDAQKELFNLVLTLKINSILSNQWIEKIRDNI